MGRLLGAESAASGVVAVIGTTAGNVHVGCTAQIVAVVGTVCHIAFDRWVRVGVVETLGGGVIGRLATGRGKTVTTGALAAVRISAVHMNDRTAALRAAAVAGTVGHGAL